MKYDIARWCVHVVTNCDCSIVNHDIRSTKTNNVRAHELRPKKKERVFGDVPTRPKSRKT
jgi:hypothetical protein